MEYFVLALILIPIVLVSGFVLFFLYLVIKSYFDIRNLEKKVLELRSEYISFMARSAWANELKIPYTKEFTITYELENQLITTKNISQMNYLGILQNLVKELDSIIDSSSESLKKTEPSKSFIETFYILKKEIQTLNPFTK